MLKNRSKDRDNNFLVMSPLLRKEKGWPTDVGHNSWWHMECVQHRAHNHKFEKMELFTHPGGCHKKTTCLKVATTLENFSNQPRHCQKPKTTFYMIISGPVFITQHNTIEAHCDTGPLLLTCRLLTLIPAWMSNHMPNKARDKFVYLSGWSLGIGK